MRRGPRPGGHVVQIASDARARSEPNLSVRGIQRCLAPITPERRGANGCGSASQRQLAQWPRVDAETGPRMAAMMLSDIRDQALRSGRRARLFRTAAVSG